MVVGPSNASRWSEVSSMMGWYGNGMGPWGWVLMVAAMSFFWGLVILAGIMIFRGSGSSNRPQERGALQILDERFARGEVDREEYEARKAVLQGVLPR